ncbi:MAG: nitrile hydratase subunit alpha [Rhodospirillales bacterium]|nr:nitrile hydratase subunit alpha [Rhodospirillales bacterium]
MTNHDTQHIIDIHAQLHSDLPSDPALRVKALESLLVEKGLLNSQTVDEWIELFTEEVGPKNGAAVVARAWTDPDFKARLLENTSEAVGEMGFLGTQGTHLVAVENTPQVHNVVVCTLCSCYPWPLLGLPPSWYKSAAYRARIVRNPRDVLKEFGLELADDVEVRVWDSTSEMRYLVVPKRPEGTDGMTADQLAGLVSRNSMVGTEQATLPAAPAKGA